MRAGPGSRPQTSARHAARRAVATLALSLLALLGAGTASALAGPGVVITQGAAGTEQVISGAQIAGAADTGAHSYTIRDRIGGPSQTLSLSGLSIRGLLALAGIDAGTVDYVSVVRADGSVLVLQGSDIRSPPFPDGPALVTNEGSTTRFLRPARSAGGTADNVTSAPGTPIEMTVSGGSLLAVEATASPSTVPVGKPVTLRARVKRAPAGAQLTYVWDFGDGTRGFGASITHTYQVSGDLQAQVKVQGSGGATPQCASVCSGVEAVDVTVTGKVRGPKQQQGLPTGSGNSGDLGGTGNGGTGTGPGSGDGTGGTANGTSSEPASQRPPKNVRPQRATRPESHERFSADPNSGAGKTIISGTLLEGSGSVINSSLPQPKASGSPKAAKGTPGTSGSGISVPGSMLLAAGVMWAGALRERRRVRLRLA
jgi:hypothetical protein